MGAVALDGSGQGQYLGLAGARGGEDADDLLADRTRLRWSSAGHPPPVLLAADGTQLAYTEVGSGPPLVTSTP